MADLSLLYIVGPTLVVTLFLLVFIRSNIYKRICTILILVLWAKALVDLLFYAGFGVFGVWTGASQGVDDGVIAAQFGLEIFRSAAFVLEELLTWGFAAFFAVIIGSFYLGITCFRKKGGSLPEKMSKVGFSKTFENPLTAKMDVFGLQSYLIIGLVTMPSMISIMLSMESAGYSTFTITVVYYVLLFYRFSLMAYTRIAKKAGLRYEKEDLGTKYQKRMISWFTILNLFISVVTLGYTFVFNRPTMVALSLATLNELEGLLAAVLILPFAEGFAVLFFNRFWRFWARLGTRIRGINLRSALYSLTRGLLIGGACFVLFYSMISFVTAAATFFSLGQNPPVFDAEKGASSIYSFIGPIHDTLISTGSSSTPYSLLLLPMLWALVALFLFQFIKVLIGGSLTHRKKVAPEYSILVASIAMVILIWVLMPATNFVLEQVPVGLISSSGSGTWAYWLVPDALSSSVATLFYFVPAPGDLLYVLFLDFPIWLFGSLLFTYFFIFRRPLVPEKKEAGVFPSSDFFKLFISFCVIVVASVATLAAITSATPFGDAVHALLSKLWFPKASDLWLFSTVGPAWVFFHNMIRFLLTVFTPLVLWISMIGIWKWLHGEKVKSAIWYLLAIAIFVLEAVFFVDRFTYLAVIAIPLVFAALYRIFYRLLKGTHPKTMFRTTFLKISFYSLILCEIYSTAIAFADRYMFPLPGYSQSFASFGNLGLLLFLLILIPHSFIEVPAIMLSGLIGLYVARRMTVMLDENEMKLDKFVTEGKSLLFSRKIWYPILFVTAFFAIAAVIEIYVSYGIMEPLANMFGFA
jgi:hypothetical protein